MIRQPSHVCPCCPCPHPIITLPHSEGSVIAYYMSEFVVPKYCEEKLDHAMANRQNLVQRLNPRLRNPMLRVESVIAFRECCVTVWDWGGREALVFHWSP